MTPIQTTARPTVILATLTAIAIALAVCATAATVIVASDVTRARDAAYAREARIDGSIEAARAELATAPALRALVDSLAAPLTPFAPVDSLTIARLTAGWDDSSRRPRRAVFATGAWRPAGGGRPRTARRELAAALGALRGDSAHDAAQLAEAVADTASDWLQSWRRFAGGTPLPAFWGYREGLPGVTSAFDLPLREHSGARYLSMLNELAGRVALQRGDHAAAERRGRENVAASRHYLDSPLLADFVFGRGLALAGARLVAAAAAAGGSASTRRQAEALAAYAQAGGSAFRALRRAAERDAASPSGTLAYELFDDEKLPFAVRVEILYATIDGACHHTREVLFGFDPRREARLAELAARHAGHPVMGDALRLIPAAARRAREVPSSLLRPDAAPMPAVLERLLPEPVAMRAVLCEQL